MLIVVYMAEINKTKDSVLTGVFINETRARSPAQTYIQKHDGGVANSGVLPVSWLKDELAPESDQDGRS